MGFLSCQPFIKLLNLQCQIIFILMKQQEEEQAFECAQKQTPLQTINIIPLQHPFQNPYNKSKSREDVGWKFNPIDRPIPLVCSHQKQTRNISFEDDDEDSNSEEDISIEDEFRQSSFIEYYSNFQEVYRKRLGFGTNWIGRKQYYTSTFIDPSRIEKHNLPYFTPDSPFDMEQIPDVKCGFDSQFQSGNLHSVYKVDQCEYDLLLQNDLNTKGNTQWFYFRIINPPRNKTLTLNIVNFRKTDSLFNYGLMPCIYSMQEFKKSKKGWHRGGKAISYFKNSHEIQNSRRFYYTLTFKISTPHDKDVLLIAHSFPYTLTDLNRYTDNLLKLKYKKELLEKETLINTIGNNKIQVLTIKQPSRVVRNKPLILVIARQHPGQTPGSFVCEGLIDYFLARDKESEYLRRNYEIKVIPMMNPDGVVAGNYRTNLFGFDLNRRWDGGSRKNLQESTYIKRYFTQLSKTREIAFILDLHGHSRKLFSFFYGNPCSSNPIQPRIYPLLCSKLAPQKIRFEDSTFTTDQYKRNTARIQFGSSFKIPYIYTYEVSFFGYIAKSKQKEHFSIQTIRQLGHHLGRAIYLHQRGKELYPNMPEHKDIFLYRKCINELKNNSSLITVGDQENSGSESDPEQCEVKEKEADKLQENDDYYCNKSISKVKIVKKIMKKEPPVKQIYKSLRQMQVLDIAQVHSAFPSNIIALIPTSYITKLKKTTFAHSQVQTDESPLVKIYSTCKQHESFQGFSQSEKHLSPSISVSLEKRNSSNLLKSNIMNKPRATVHDMQTRQYTPATQRKTRQYHKRQHTLSSAKRQPTNIKKKKYIDKAVQTALSFGKSYTVNQNSSVILPQSQGSINNLEKTANISFNTLNSWKTKNSNEANLLQYKSIDPSYSTILPTKTKMDSKLLGRNISKSIVENMKKRRNNGV